MPSPRHSDDGDDISITSTPPSEPQDEYEVEDVLAEREFGTQLMYLVKWAGYPLDRCTWEPEDSFCDTQTMRDWSSKKEAIAQQKETPFDVDAFMVKVQAAVDAATLRKQRRKKKRIRLGIPISPDGSSEDEDNEQSPEGCFVPGDVGGDGTHEKPEETKTKKTTKESVSSESNGTVPSNSVADKDLQSTGDVKKNVSGSNGHSTLRTELNSTSKSPQSQRRPSAVQKSTTTIFGSRPLSKVRKRLLPSSAQQNQDSTSANSIFRNLSTQRRYEKAMQRDRTPDISQLDVRTPNDWANSQNKPSDIGRQLPKNRGIETGTESLFVEQDIPEPEPQPESLRDDAGHDHRDTAEGEVIRDIARPNREPTHSHNPTPHPTADGAMPFPQMSVKKRHWQPGEVMVHLKFGAVDATVGDVRISGLNRTNTWRLLKLKSKNQILIDFRHICTYDEYGQLCKTGYNTTYANGWVIGFDDTTDALHNVTKYLRDHDVAALWYHPEDEAQLVLVAYASGSPKWSFLDNNVFVNSEHSLRIVARGTLPPFSSIDSAKAPTPDLRPAELGLSSLEMTNTDSVDAEDGPPITPCHSPLTPTMPVPEKSDDVLNVKNFDIDVFFRENYRISFKELSFVKTKKGQERVRAFYLHFPEEPEGVNNEFELIRLFLGHHNIAAFSNRQSKDWERFVATANAGTILFHQNYIFYEAMPQLNKILHQPSFNIFSVSLDRCIEGSADSHLQRLFPSGGVVLITEDFIINETARALEVLEWFGEFVKVTSEWKLFFRPNVQQWLFNLFDAWPDDKMYQIYCWINHLIPRYPPSHYNFHRRQGSPDSLDGLTDDDGQHHPFISTRDLPGYGSRSEMDHEAIPKGLTQEERNTDHLVEYFAGWAVMNCHKYRKFFVLTHFKPQPRWKRWNHLTITNSEEFLKRVSKNKRHSSKEHGASRANSGASTASSNRRQSSDKLMPPPPRPSTQFPSLEGRSSTHHSSRAPSTPAAAAHSPSEMMDLD